MNRHPVAAEVTRRTKLGASEIRFRTSAATGFMAPMLFNNWRRSAETPLRLKDMPVCGRFVLCCRALTRWVNLSIESSGVCPATL